MRLVLVHDESTRCVGRYAVKFRVGCSVTFEAARKSRKRVASRVVESARLSRRQNRGNRRENRRGSICNEPEETARRTSRTSRNDIQRDGSGCNSSLHRL